MLTRIGSHVRANVVAYLALFAALGGTGYAAAKFDGGDIKNGTIRSKDIGNGQVTKRNVKKKNLTGRNIQNDSLTGHEINESTLNFSASSIATLGRALPSGVTVTGVFLTSAEDDGQTVEAEGVASFPAPAPTTLGDNNVNFAPSPVASDPAASCSGTAANPTAPAGNVCLYPTSIGANSNPGTAQGLALDSGSRYGFRVKGPTGTDSAGVRGSWAYTAP
jgi:hypothetical protein